MARRDRTRSLAVGGFAAGVAAAVAAVVSGLAGGSPGALSQAKAAEATITSHTVAFGHARVAVQVRPGGLACFQVKQGTSTVARSCAASLAPDQIEYASSRYAVGGLAGTDVRAVIVRLTRRGTVWATLKRGAFYGAVPKGHNVRAVVKVLRDGTRKAFTVTGPR
jgi:hypothetical protein